MPRHAQLSPTDRVVAMAAIGEAVLGIVKETGLLRTKRRAARKMKRKPREAKAPRKTRQSKTTASTDMPTNPTNGSAV